MEYIISTLVLSGIALIVIIFKTFSYMERTERAIAERAEE